MFQESYFSSAFMIRTSACDFLFPSPGFWCTTTPNHSLDVVSELMVQEGIHERVDC